MAQVIVDPAEVRRFVSIMEQEVRALRERQRVLEASRRELAEVWRDTRYIGFERTYIPAMQVLERFEKLADEYARLLRGKAERAERYLGRR